MDQIVAANSYGMLTIVAGLSLVLLLQAASAGLQTFATRKVARYAFNRQLRGRLWTLYVLIGVPLLVVSSALEHAGWPLAGLLVCFVGAALPLRRFVRSAPQQSGSSDAWATPSWGECLALSVGAALSLLVAEALAMLLAGILGLGAVAAVLASLGQ